MASADSTYRAAIATCLRAEGFAVLDLTDLGNDDDTVDAIAHSDADAALVCTNLFSESIAGALARLGTLRPDLPTAVVASRADERMEERVLASGAADFFDRTRAPSIVAKRMRLLVLGARATAPPVGDRSDAEFTCGALTLRRDSHRALWRGVEVPFTVTEFRIVQLLATSGVCGATYRAIYDVVHGPGFSAGDGPDGFRTNVRSLVRRIRAKLRRCGAPDDIVQNLPGAGYRWRDAADADADADAGKSDLRDMGVVG